MKRPAQRFKPFSQIDRWTIAIFMFALVVLVAGVFDLVAEHNRPVTALQIVVPISAVLLGSEMYSAFNKSAEDPSGVNNGRSIYLDRAHTFGLLQAMMIDLKQIEDSEQIDPGSPEVAITRTHHSAMRALHQALFEFSEVPTVNLGAMRVFVDSVDGVILETPSMFRATSALLPVFSAALESSPFVDQTMQGSEPADAQPYSVDIRDPKKMPAGSTSLPPIDLTN